MSDASGRTITESGNVIYQRTQRGWINSVGLWPVALPVSILLVVSTWPPVPPYFDTAAAVLFALVSAWKLFNASRQMVVALGENHLQYIGMGKAWYFYFRDLAGVAMADDVGLFSLPLSGRRTRAGQVPRHIVFIMRNGNRVNICLSWFDAETLLLDIDARLPKKVERGERYEETLAALKA